MFAIIYLLAVVPLPHARSEVWSYFGFIADDEGEIQDKKKAICKICATTLSYSGNTTNLFTHLKAMHPEANPQKLAPTNRTPRTGRKMSKRKYIDALTSTGVIQTSQITLDNGQPYVLRAITITNNNMPISSDSSNTDGHATRSKTAKLSTSLLPGGEDGDAETKASGVVMTDDITMALVTMLVKDCRPVSLLEGKGFRDVIKLLAPDYKIPDTKTIETLCKKRYDEFRRTQILRGIEEESA